MEEVRFLRGEENKHAAPLADATFRDSEQKSMSEGDPQVFSSAMGQSVGFFVIGVLVSFIEVVPQLVRIGPAQLSPVPNQACGSGEMGGHRGSLCG